MKLKGFLGVSFEAETLDLDDGRQLRFVLRKVFIAFQGHVDEQEIQKD